MNKRGDNINITPVRNIGIPQLNSAKPISKTIVKPSYSKGFKSDIDEIISILESQTLEDKEDNFNVFAQISNDLKFNNIIEEDIEDVEYVDNIFNNKSNSKPIKELNRRIKRKSIQLHK